MNKIHINVVHIIILLIILILPKNALSYNTHADSPISRGGHEEITTNTIDKINFSPKLKLILVSKRGDLERSVAAEDSNPQPVTHFYNPATGKGLYSFFASAKERAIYYYGLAVKSKSWSYLGSTLHLLQYMAAPSHANSAPHMY